MLYNTGVSTTGTLNTNVMTVDEANSAKVASMLISNYSHPVTPVRELIVNALEAIQNNPKGKVKVSLESNGENTGVFTDSIADENTQHTVVVEDNGVGMSHDFVTNKFSKLTYSTKDHSDDHVGGFGIGSKGIMSIATQAVFRTVHNKELTVCVLSLAPEGIGISVSDPMVADEPNGTTVTAHIGVDDYRMISNTIEGKFLNFLDPSTPLEVTVNGVNKHIGSFVDTHDGKGYVHTHDDGLTTTLVVDDSFMVGLSIRVLGMPYPGILTGDDFTKISNRFDELSELGFNASFLWHNNVGITVDMPPEDVVIHSSRESVAETLHLKNKVIDRVVEAVTGYSKWIKSTLSYDEDRGVEGLSDDLSRVLNSDMFQTMFRAPLELHSIVRRADSILEEKENYTEEGSKVVALSLSGWGVERLGLHFHYRICDIANKDEFKHMVYGTLAGRNGAPKSLKAAVGSDLSVQEILGVDEDVTHVMVVNDEDLDNHQGNTGVVSSCLDGFDSLSDIEAISLLSGVKVTVDETKSKARKNAILAKGRDIIRKDSKENPGAHSLVAMYTPQGFKYFKGTRGLSNWITKESSNQKLVMVVSGYNFSTLENNEEVAKFAKGNKDYLCLFCNPDVSSDASSSVIRAAERVGSFHGIARVDNTDVSDHIAAADLPGIFQDRSLQGVNIVDKGLVSLYANNEYCMREIMSFLGYDLDAVDRAIQGLDERLPAPQNLLGYNGRNIIRLVTQGALWGNAEDEKFLADGVDNDYRISRAQALGLAEDMAVDGVLSKSGLGHFEGSQEEIMKVIVIAGALIDRGIHDMLVEVLGG